MTVATPLSAEAADETTVIVLGIRSLEGDDDFARNLTGALVHGAAQVPGWKLDEREVSLAQMALVHGCDEPDAACMANVASGLGVQRVIYGTVRRTSAGSNYDFSLALYLFNAETSRIEGSVADSIPRVMTDVDNLRPRVQGYLRRLSGQTGVGAIRIKANVPEAGVSIDGEAVGITDGEGILLVENIGEGRHRVEVTAEDHTRFGGTVSVGPDEEVLIEVTLQETQVRETFVEAEGSRISWPTYLSFGLFLALGAGNIVSFVKSKQLEDDFDDEVRYPYLGTVSPTMNACDAARTDESLRGADEDVAEVLDLCSDKDRLKRMMLGFGITAVVALVAGTISLISDLSGDEDEDEGATLTLNPSFDRRGAYLDATLQF